MPSPELLWSLFHDPSVIFVIALRCLKRLTLRKHGEGDRRRREDVDRGAKIRRALISSHIFEHFRSHITLRTQEIVTNAISVGADDRTCKTKVVNLQLAVLIQQHILNLDVPVCQTLLVNVFERL